jgi:hypothetical protein
LETPRHGEWKIHSLRKKDDFHNFSSPSYTTMPRSGVFFFFVFEKRKKGYMPVPILPDFVFIIIRVAVKRAVLT